MLFKVKLTELINLMKNIDEICQCHCCKTESVICYFIVCIDYLKIDFYKKTDYYKKQKIKTDSF